MFFTYQPRQDRQNLGFDAETKKGKTDNKIATRIIRTQRGESINVNKKSERYKNRNKHVVFSLHCTQKKWANESR